MKIALHSEALENCHAIFLPYLRHEHKERLRRRVESRGSKTEFLALERGNLFNQEDARRSTEKRREEDKETNLPCSCTPDGSQCCALTVVSSPVEDKKQTTSVRREKKHNLLQKT